MVGVAEKTDSAMAVLSSKLNTLKAASDLLEAQLYALKQKLVFPIWAEESAALNANAYEWSFGNGSTGNDIGIPVPINCELISSTLNADTFGTSVEIIIERNGVSIATHLFNSNNEVVSESSPVAFAVGDLVNFKTGALTGSSTDARVCAWFRTIVPGSLSFGFSSGFSI